MLKTKIIDQEHQRTVLANGLTILSIEKNDIDSIAIEVWIKVGSRYERSELNGLAHFIEHMNFKGTKRRNAEQIAEEMDAVGGYINAYTSKENTVYSARIMKEYLSLAIDMLSDIIFHSVYESEEIEREKNVVLQELAQTEDSPEEMVMEYFSSLCYQDQPIGRSILGLETNIRQFTKKHIEDFAREYYTADRIIVSVAGNVKHQELLSLIEEKFTPFTSKQAVECSQAVYSGGITLKNQPDLSQLHLVIGYQGISVTSDEYYANEILAGILGGSISSRLFQEIREKRGLVYSIGTFCQYYNDSGIFAIALGSTSDNLTEILNLLNIELNKICQSIKQSEIDRCLAQVRSSLFMSRENVENLASILANNYSCFGRYIPREEIWQGYCQVTLAQLLNLAKKIFSSKREITIAAIGDVASLPEEQVLKQLLGTS